MLQTALISAGSVGFVRKPRNCPSSLSRKYLLLQFLKCSPLLKRVPSLTTPGPSPSLTSASATSTMLTVSSMSRRRPLPL